MPFDPSTITRIWPPIVKGGQVYLSWQSSAPAGTPFQVYLNGELAWHGQSLGAWVTVPSGPVRVDIGAVGPGEENTDFSSTLPAAPHRRAELSWHGGTFEGPDIAGFRVFGEASPGAGVDYATALADIVAYPQGIDTSGWGMGGWGLGGWGSSAGTYSWTSGPLSSGTWTFAVRPYDAAGNLGPARTTIVAICAPPREPATFPDGTRLHYSLIGFGGLPWGGGGFGLPEAILTWNSSPS